MNIKEAYQFSVKSTSDINEHLLTLYNYALKCNHITEFGVRWGTSTLAFLAANTCKVISYDFCLYPEVQDIIDKTKKENIDFTFIQKDVLDVDIEQTDLLFIDTFHHPLQLQRELSRHSHKVNKYIIIHDTETHKRINEILWPDERIAMKEKDTSEYDNYPNIGIFPIIIEFLYNNKEWSIKEIFSNNNGLTILEKDAPC